MSERIDHAAKSEEVHEYIGENFIAEQGLTDTTALMGSIDSLRHAVLALVEQQRIANLIALSKALDGHGYQAEEPLDALFAYDGTSDDGFNGLHIHPEIAAALGIKQGEER